VLYHNAQGEEIMRVCECTRQSSQRVVSRVWRAAIPRHFRDFSLATFPRDAGKRAAWELCVRYAHEMPAASVLLAGEVGAGKTGLAIGIAREFAAAGKAILFVSMVDMLGELRASFDDRRISFSDKFTALKDVDFLVMDDLASVNPTAWTRETLYRLINYRHNEMLATAFTVDVTDSQLKQIVTARTADRIYEMSRDWQVAVGGANLRRR